MALLPTSKNEITTQDPKNLILFGLPKVGKTTALAQLPNALIVDLENGSDYIQGFCVKARTVGEIRKIARALDPSHETYEKHNYKYVVIDTITALEDMALPYAKKLYMATPKHTWAV